MSTSFESARFGRVAVPDEAVVEFPTGLIGLGGAHWALLTDDAENPFLWLHSIEDPELALPITNPFSFFPEYEVVLSDAEAARVGVTDPADCDVFVTVVAAESLEDFRANLRAPILISQGRGHQVINEADDAPVRAPLFAQAAVAEWAA